MQPKYIFTDERKEVKGRTVTRIKAIKSFNDVKEGDLGGFLEKEENLSHSGKCWVYDDACVYDNARVYGDAIVCDDAKVFNNAKIYNYAMVDGTASVSGNAKVHGTANVRMKAKILDVVDIYGAALVTGNAVVCGEAQVHDSARIYDNARIIGCCSISGNVVISGSTLIDEVSVQCGNFKMDAYIRDVSDYVVVDRLFGDAFVAPISFYKKYDNTIGVSTYEFDGSIDEFKNKIITVYNDEYDDVDVTKYLLLLEFIRIHFNNN